ncbi:MAG: TIGR00341 family protein [Syntrophobacteria bacterium]|jgi:uncharacterized hydrophobic protein (TIGR00271 family)
MNTMVVLTQRESAKALVRWAARFAQIRNTHLTVLFCLFGEPSLPAEPVTAEHPAGSEELLQVAAEAISEIQDREVHLFVTRHPDPAQAIIKEIQDRKVDFLCASMDSTQPKDSRVNKLGRWLLRFARCEMFLLDPGDGEGTSYQRIMLPMDWALDAFTLHTAVDLGQKLDCIIKPLEVGSYFGTDSQAVAKRSLESKLKEAGIEPSKSIEPAITLIGRKWKGIVHKSRDSDLVLIGATSTRHLRKFRDEEKRHISREAPRVAIGCIRPKSQVSEPSWMGFIGSRILGWLPVLDAEDRIDLFDRLQVGARWNVDFIMMMCLSTAIASLGLIQNSTAVVIGAMVVAPLMTPLIGSGLALVQGNTSLFRDSIKAMGFGIGAALLISIFFGFIAPIEELTPELLARGAPTLIDLVVAFLSGVAAAYAVARPSLLGALAGVAIAAALVPPLATVGISFAEGAWKISEGAAILFLTNLVAIILGAAFIYRRLGIQGTRLGISSPLWMRRMVLFLILIAVMLTAPLGFKLAQQRRAGQTRPYTLPVSQSVRQAIKERIHQEYGVTLISALRFGAKSDTEAAIIISAQKPVSVNLISDLKQLVNDKMGENVRVAVHALQEARLKRTKF